MNGIDTFDDLVDLLDLTDVQVNEVWGKRHDARTEDDPAPGPRESELSLSQRIDDDTLAFRGRLEIHAKQAMLVVDLEARFLLTRPVEMPGEDVLAEFARKVGVPIIYPYLRAEVQQLARQLGVPPPLLRPYRDQDFATDRAAMA